MRRRNATDDQSGHVAEAGALAIFGCARRDAIGDDLGVVHHARIGHGTPLFFGLRDRLNRRQIAGALSKQNGPERTRSPALILRTRKFTDYGVAGAGVGAAACFTGEVSETTLPSRRSSASESWKSSYFLPSSGTNRRHLGVALCAFRIEMAGQRRFAARGELIGFRLIFLVQIGHRDVGCNAGRLNRAPGGGIIFRRRQTQSTAPLAAQRDDCLHPSPCPKEVTPTMVSAAVILQRTGNDFGGRGCAFVNQHDDRLAVGDIAAARIVALGVFRLAAAGRNDFSAGQEIIGDGDRLIEQSAGSLRKSIT